MRTADDIEQGLHALEAELPFAGGPREQVVERVLVLAFLRAQGSAYPTAAGFPLIWRSN